MTSYRDTKYKYKPSDDGTGVVSFLQQLEHPPLVCTDMAYLPSEKIREADEVIDLHKAGNSDEARRKFNVLMTTAVPYESQRQGGFVMYAFIKEGQSKYGHSGEITERHPPFDGLVKRVEPSTPQVKKEGAPLPSDKLKELFAGVKQQKQAKLAALAKQKK